MLKGCFDAGPVLADLAGELNERRQLQREAQASHAVSILSAWGSFFGSVHHGLLMEQLRRRVTDKRVLRLVRQFLGAGVIRHGFLTATPSGTPQRGDGLQPPRPPNTPPAASSPNSNASDTPSPWKPPLLHPPSFPISQRVYESPFGSSRRVLGRAEKA